MKCWTYVIMQKVLFCYSFRESLYCLTSTFPYAIWLNVIAQYLIQKK